MILFRQLTEPLPPYFHLPHWQVEFWPDSESSRPWGLAWVTIPPAELLPPILDYILVCDDHRREGIAHAIIAACRERWPCIQLTDAISPEGEALLASVDPD